MKFLGAGLVIGLVVQAVNIIAPQAAHAVVPSDNCFAIDSGTNAIIGYYRTENDLPGQPDCPKDVDVPSVIAGTTITKIGFVAFRALGLQSITLPNTITEIQGQAFQYNLLTSVTIPSSVTTLGNYVFASNELTSANVPNTVTSMGLGVFANNQITTFSLPTGMTTIPDQTFSSNMLTSVTIPTGVTSVGDSAFIANQITSITFPSSLTTIGNSAFAANKLTTLSLPSTITSLGSQAFSSNQLTSVTLPNAITDIPDYLFNKNRLQTITIPNTVTSIGDSAFAFNNIESATIPNSVTSIHRGAFAYQTAGDIQQVNQLFWGPQGSDPTAATVLQAQGMIYFARLYTQDPSNPNGLTDGVYFQNTETNGDGMYDDPEIAGGYLINPASVTVTYKDQTGSVVRQPLVVTAPGIYSYFISDAPAVPKAADTFGPTPAELAAMQNAVAVYYRVGSNFSYTAPVIGGVSPAPSSRAFVLGASTTVAPFVYNIASSPASTPSPASGGATGGLANTGENQVTLISTISAGLLMIITTVLVRIVRSRQSSNTL